MTENSYLPKKHDLKKSTLKVHQKLLFLLSRLSHWVKYNNPKSFVFSSEFVSWLGFQFLRSSLLPGLRGPWFWRVIRCCWTEFFETSNSGACIWRHRLETSSPSEAVQNIVIAKSVNFRGHSKYRDDPNSGFFIAFVFVIIWLDKNCGHNCCSITILQ